MSKKEVIIKILTELNKNNKILTIEELETERQEYEIVLTIMQQSGLIYGVEFIKAGRQGAMINTDNAIITISGIEYLEQNSKKQTFHLERIADSLEDIKKILKNKLVD